jgi:polysaccharide pyruvyl transferase WcaK-like protein
VAVLEPCATSKQSNGDEALIHGLCRFLSESGSSSIDLVTFADENPVALPPGARHGGYLYKSGDSLPRKIVRYFQWPWMLSKYDQFYIIGADLIDGYYGWSVSDRLFRLLDMASRAGVETNLVSCSFNNSAPARVQESMRRYLSRTRVHARDKYSAERLSHVLGRRVDHSADVAFGLEPRETLHTDAIKRWIASQRAEDRLVIGLNVNAMPVVMKDRNTTNEYLSEWANWIDHVVLAGVSIVLLPHDYRGEYSDERVARQVCSGSRATSQHRCHLSQQPLNASESKCIAQVCDLVVSGRMHLAIAALGVGVPVVAYGYQEKFEGILSLFDLEQQVRSIENISNNLLGEVAFTLAAVGSSQALRRMCVERAHAVVELARRNVLSS